MKESAFTNAIMDTKNAPIFVPSGFFFEGLFIPNAIAPMMALSGAFDD